MLYLNLLFFLQTLYMKLLSKLTKRNSCWSVLPPEHCPVPKRGDKIPVGTAVAEALSNFTSTHRTEQNAALDF